MTTPSSSRPDPTRLRIDTDLGVARLDGHVLDLNRREVAVLAALAENPGRVVPRRVLARRAGLVDASPRRCEALLVGLRRVLGPGAVLNVRGRGWILVLPVADKDAHAVETVA